MYADVIIDISLSRLDQTFQYRVPPELESELEPGDVVLVPFGRGERKSKAYLLRLTATSSYPPEKQKFIEKKVTGSVGAESKLVSLALWMRDYYGSPTVLALRTVLPFRSKVPEKKKEQVVLLLGRQQAREELSELKRKHQKARARLLEALIEEPVLPMEVVTGTLRVSRSGLQPLLEKNWIRCDREQIYRTPAVLEQLKLQSLQREEERGGSASGHTLTAEQQRAVEVICRNWDREDGKPREYLLHGITGSGKTAVYMELIAENLKRGRQAILLIPEISLTYQNVVRFYRAFGDRISILHSRLSPSERYDQFERAKAGEIDVMIGPRSALFTPFERLGLILIDEEHEASYRSETTPRYDAREVARKRAALEQADLVLGSATPSMESYYRTVQKESTLLTLRQRPAGSRLPYVITADMRKELRAGSSSMLSRILLEKLRNTLDRGLQSMLFLNRRGFSGFVSCRSCGHVIKCPHCDVSLSLHQGGKLDCHYCGYSRMNVKQCEVCGSSFIGGFKAGTQQVEAVVAAAFPKARILRMDADTTKGKDGHAEILRAFGKGEADILIGTQMIVKGHDFPNVALVGVLAADLSLNISEFRAAERTYQLLAQAAGRAGRGGIPGEVVIQTYQPEHYAIVCAANQNYEAFYDQEIRYRRLSGYPPVGGLLSIHCSHEEEEQLNLAMKHLAAFARTLAEKYRATVLGPGDEAIAKIQDSYRKALYIRHENEAILTRMKNYLEQYIEMNRGFDPIKINFER